ncbi:MAG: bifunctional homocysteine S-methyltransferase/methylenetetrahydrofolate reductase [Chloroflexi bacterium GWB2_49_20]|nr:MAG: bifunctional homocysteine S-methyltransferase/methylenetetrahydrofolate reductase [Chloroflexi bacterium GWB2_49_20]OGN80493.1 MAG: bifunctional homocysteine S-methyltransferase/methylenetetrahydrofolate reductase [Chloroflexi bacterium GWC2_49_37]OGN83328.1 MAG: bifunctional homocysteine S-methyltransferase/methylenetetrahydrofolate reductase [Chloroflexi bacterium GWD2_49_16]HCC78184.1 bifunctional homocysteine S-methyltransferase/methylenetetrahydrofolate reductase [Anaerolineae bacte
MKNYPFLQQLSTRPLLSDGAMGTMLHGRGVSFEQCFDELNLTDPDLIADIHKEYVLAGADILQTNTFGANRFKLARHGLEDRVANINQAGVEQARRAIAASQVDRPILVAGDVGPLGVRIAPYGRVQPEQARQAFSEQITALAAAGVDLLMIETISDLYEIVAAIQAAREVRKRKNAPLPICASMTFTRDDRTLLGDDPAKVARSLAEAGADVIGVNCSGGPAQLLRLLKAMRQAVPQAFLLVQPNAGWPEQMGGRIMYPADPEYFGNYALAFCEAGASIVGGCCGTTPQHITAMRVALDENPQGCGSLENVLALPDESGEVPETTPETSRLAQRLSQGKFCIAVEMDPPRGISTHKLVAGASLLAEAGADVINVADSPMARMRMSAWAVCDVVQRQVGVDSTLHFPTRGRNLLRVQGDLLAAHALGIRNVFVVMGDPTAIGDYPEAMDNYDLVPSGLIKLIKQGFNTGVDHSGTSIGQPTAFFVGSALNLNPPEPEKEIKNLHRKVKSGADFFLTQPIYRPEEGPVFLEKYEQEYGKLNKPILAGILPLVSLKHATFLNNEVPGISIPAEILARLEQAGDQAARVGVETTVELVRQIKTWAQGIYLMPQFHRYDLVAEIIEAVKEK